MTIESNSSIWQDNPTGGGSTSSERYLNKLARNAFLNFWSYSNPYTDESNGNELCDFMVVFGNEVILFSDKHCKFPEHPNINTSWNRWYKSAIEKSARQLAGAASFIERFPNRIYLDSACKKPLPIPLPSPENLNIHLVAVTRGSADAAKRHWGGNSSSTLMINTNLEGRDHENHPFMIGWPLKNRRFVHVFDELTIDILLRELDTAPDFIDYLTKKEAFLSQKGVNFIICGEEDLLATYITNPLPNFDGFSFPAIPSDCKMAGIEEGKWEQFSKSAAYVIWKNLKELSYEWDSLIEHQTAHIHRETAPVIAKNDPTLQDIQAHEFILRAMAEERRLARQHIAESHKSVLTRKIAGDRVFRIINIPLRAKHSSRAYVLLALRQPPGHDYEDYRRQRKISLIGLCRASRLMNIGIDEVIGIASEQLDSKNITQDFIYMRDDKPLTAEERDKELQELRAAGIWKEKWTLPS